MMLDFIVNLWTLYVGDVMMLDSIATAKTLWVGGVILSVFYSLFQDASLMGGVMLPDFVVTPNCFICELG